MTIIYSDCSPANDDHEITAYRLVAQSIPCNHNRQHDQADGTLCDVCNKIAEVESQIEDLHSRLKVLHETHRTFRIKRNGVSDIISRFPLEIASYIFFLCLPVTWKEDSMFPRSESECSSFRTPHLPLTLSAVCHSWRCLASCIPRLWSTLSIDVDKANLQYLNHRFQCSGPAPLVVQLHARSRTKYPNFESTHVPDVIALVKQNFHRMATLCLRLSCPFLKEYFSQGLDASNTLARPILEELHVHCSVDRCLEPRTTLLSIDPLRLHDVFVTPCSLTNIQLNWGHIRCLCLDTDRQEEVDPALIAHALSLLPQGTRLRAIDLMVKYPNNSTPPVGMIFTQNSIRGLTLSFNSSKILSHVTMPNLEALCLWRMRCDTRDHLISFLRRSACPLKVMYWEPSSALPLESELFIEVFQYTPNLHELELKLSVDTEKHLIPFLERLGMVPPLDTESTAQLRNHSCGTFLPMLQKFVYKGPMTHVPLKRFLDIIESRSAFPTTNHGQVTKPLREISLYRPDRKSDPKTEPDQQRICCLAAAGIKVSVLTYNPGDDVLNIPCLSTEYYDE